MKKTIIALILLTTVLFGKSQTNDTNTVCVPYNVAKKIAKQLVEGDSAKAVLAITYQELDLMNQQVGYKDSIILNQRLKEINFLSQLRDKDIIITNKDRQIGDVSKNYKTLSRKYKWAKMQATVGGALAMVFGGILLYTNIIR